MFLHIPGMQLFVADRTDQQLMTALTAQDGRTDRFQ